MTTALTDALTDQGTPPVVLCHISHVYETGASLYFTVLCAQADDPLAQWRRAKDAANTAIRARGRDDHPSPRRRHRSSRRSTSRRSGRSRVGMLRAVKASVDPVGILNPGVLVG